MLAVRGLWADGTSRQELPYSYENYCFRRDCLMIQENALYSYEKKSRYQTGTYTRMPVSQNIVSSFLLFI